MWNLLKIFLFYRKFRITRCGANLVPAPELVSKFNSTLMQAIVNLEKVKQTKSISAIEILGCWTLVDCMRSLPFHRYFRRSSFTSSWVMLEVKCTVFTLISLNGMYGKQQLFRHVILKPASAFSSDTRVSQCFSVCLGFSDIILYIDTLVEQ